MTAISRRRLLASTGFAILGASLAACTAAQVQAVAASVISDSALIANGLKSILPSVAAVVGISPATVTTVETIVDDIASVAGQVATVVSQNAAQPLVTQIKGDVTSLVSALGSITLPTSVSQIIAAAEALLPAIETAVGIVTALAATRRAGATNLTPDQARRILAVAALKKPA